MSIAYEHSRTVVVELEADFTQPLGLHGAPQPSRLLRVEEEKPSGARTDELADRLYAALLDGMRGYAMP